MEDTMFELVKICQEKEFLCIHDDIIDLIESALDSKLLLINSNSQRLDKKEQEVKNVIEQPAEHGNHIAPIQSTKEPGHSLSMGYEHLSITPKTESDEVTESNAENLLSIPSKCEVTLKDKIECDMPAKDVCSTVFTTFSNPLFKDNDDLDSSDDESLPDEDDGNSQQEEIDIVTETDDVLPLSVENNNDDYDVLLGEANLFLSDDSIPPGIENVADDPEGDVHFLEELLINYSILSIELQKKFPGMLDWIRVSLASSNGNKGFAMWDRRFYEESDEEPTEAGSLRYRYDRLPMHLVALPSLDYVPRTKHPPSPDYVPSSEHPTSPVYVPEPKYPEYLVLSGDEAPIEDQPLPTDALPTALSPGYVAYSDLDEDPEEDPEEDHANYPVDEMDGDDEPSDYEDYDNCKTHMKNTINLKFLQ
nr:hypothetical protein [Tanacetum cinerariifolium]